MAETPATGDGDVRDGCRGSRARATFARRLALAAALCLEGSATLLMTTRLLLGATAGIGLAGMGWYITEHLTPPAPRTARAGSGRRKYGARPRRHRFDASTSTEEGPLSGPDHVIAPAGDPRL